MARNKKTLVEDITGEICSVLSELGCEFHWEGDNRGGKHHSRYIFVRKPFAMKIRVSDHRSQRIENDKSSSRIPVLDVGPHRMSVNDAISNIKDRRKSLGPSPLAVGSGDNAANLSAGD